MLEPSFHKGWQLVNGNDLGEAADTLPAEHSWNYEAYLICLVISSMRFSDKPFSEITKDVRTEYFASQEALHLWLTSQKMAEEGIGFHDPTVFSDRASQLFVERFEKEPPSRQINIALGELYGSEASYSVQNINYYVGKVFDSYAKRQFSASLKKRTGTAMEKGAELSTKYSQLMSMDKSITDDFHESSKMASRLIDMLLDYESNPDNFKLLDWGYEQHNEKIPLSNGHLVVIGGRSGSGKTTYAMNLLRHQIMADRKVAMFSLEMSKDELTRILIAQIARIPYRSMLPGSEMSDSDQDAFFYASQLLGSTKAIFVEKPNLSVEDIQRQAHQIKIKLGGLDAIFIDHIHIMGDGGRKFNSIREKIIHISGALKNLAKELNLPIFALAQTNRSVETREDKTPFVTDLKESGSLEQDADTIIFTFRDSSVEDTKEPFVIVRKNRHGEYNDFKIPMRVNPIIRTFEEA